MKTQLGIKQKGCNEVIVSFRNHGSLALLKHGYIRFTLKELVMQKNKRLIIDLTGVKFIDDQGFDMLNLLSRLGKKYHSVIHLTGVEPEVMEIIKLLKKYSVFDINHVEPAEAVTV